MGNATPLHRSRQRSASAPSGSSKRMKRNERLGPLSVALSLVVIVLLLAKGIESTFEQVLLAGAIGYVALEMLIYVRLRNQRERANR